jgi:predicted ester cyclase
VAAADRLIVETRFAGTHRGAYRGAAPTGRPIDLPVAIVVSFRSGLMSGERFYYDRATLLAQIEAGGDARLTPPGSSSSSAPV